MATRLALLGAPATAALGLMVAGPADAEPAPALTLSARA